LKAVGDFGLSVYPPTAPYYNAAKFGINGVKDYQNFSAKKVGNMRLVITQSKSLQLYK
jgi:hypothetical protein